MPGKKPAKAPLSEIATLVEGRDCWVPVPLDFFRHQRTTEGLGRPNASWLGRYVQLFVNVNTTGFSYPLDGVAGPQADERRFILTSDDPEGPLLVARSRLTQAGRAVSVAAWNPVQDRYKEIFFQDTSVHRESGEPFTRFLSAPVDLPGPVNEGKGAYVDRFYGRQVMTVAYRLAHLFGAELPLPSGVSLPPQLHTGS